MPPTTDVRAFIWVFTALCVVALVLVVTAELSELAWLKTIEKIGQNIGRLIITVTAGTFIAVEGGSMLAAWLRRTEIREAREEGREEGENRMYREMQAWRQAMEAWGLRKDEAERDGLTFSEMPPVEPTPLSRA